MQLVNLFALLNKYLKTIVLLQLHQLSVSVVASLKLLATVLTVASDPFPAYLQGFLIVFFVNYTMSRGPSTRSGRAVRTGSIGSVTGPAVKSKAQVERECAQMNRYLARVGRGHQVATSLNQRGIIWQ